VSVTHKVMTDMLDRTHPVRPSRRCQGPDRVYDPLVPRRYATASDWLIANPPEPSRLTATLAGVAERARAGEDFRQAARDFIDEFSLLAEDSERQARIEAAPPPTGDSRHDAFLGALAEHLAAVEGLERPAWSVEPDRFLETFWFVSDVPGFRAAAIAGSPGAFKRRGVLIPERSLHRV
jgi:hypothetical protein